MTIINIRGTNGSGKSTIVRHLLDEKNGQPLLGHDGKIIGYSCENRIRVVGRYNVACGGVDTLHTRYVGDVKLKGVDVAEWLIRQWDAQGWNVVFEGMIASSIFGRWLRVSQDTRNMIWAFLDTPLEVCRERIQARNGGKPLKEKEHFVGLYERCLSSYNKMQQEGERVLWIEHTKAYEQILDLLLEEWEPISQISITESQTTSAQPEPIPALQLF